MDATRRNAGAGTRIQVTPADDTPNDGRKYPSHFFPLHYCHTGRRHPERWTHEEDNFSYEKVSRHTGRRHPERWTRIDRERGAGTQSSHRQTTPRTMDALWEHEKRICVFSHTGRRHPERWTLNRIGFGIYAPWSHRQTTPRTMDARLLLTHQ